MNGDNKEPIDVPFDFDDAAHNAAHDADNDPFRDELPPPVDPRDPDAAQRQRVANLLRSGQIAYTRGERAQARELWQEAASLAPYDEEVWRALLNVAVDVEDRRVCLENITAINPRNEWAASSLARLQAEAATTGGSLPRPARRPWLWLSLDLVLIVLKYGLLGVALGIVISLLLRGG